MKKHERWSLLPLQKEVWRLAKGKYRDACAPATAIARELRQELTAAGVAEEDHLLSVLNRMPRSLPRKKKCKETVSKNDNPKSSKGLSLKGLSSKLQLMGYTPLKPCSITMGLWHDGEKTEAEVAVPWEQVWEAKKGHCSILAKIDSEFSTIYWTLTLRLIEIGTALNPRVGFLGPYFVGEIHDILEDDFERLPCFELFLERKP